MASFFVTGNHEYYAGANEWIAELRRLGLQVLQRARLVGVHDRAAPTESSQTSPASMTFTATAFRDTARTWRAL